MYLNFYRLVLPLQIVTHILQRKLEFTKAFSAVISVVKKKGFYCERGDKSFTVSSTRDLYVWPLPV